MLRDATRTNSDDPILRRWESFPLTYFLPEVPNGASVDFAATSSFAVAYWDSVMGGGNFVETTDQAAAHLIFRYDDSASHLYGEVTLLRPSGPDISVGDVVPEQMQIYVNDTIKSPQFAQEITLHEIGHVLGLFEHANCDGATFIMDVSPGGNLNQVHPIHLNEQKMVRTIYALPQGIDMSNYSLD